MEANFDSHQYYSSDALSNGLTNDGNDEIIEDALTPPEELSRSNCTWNEKTPGGEDHSEEYQNSNFHSRSNSNAFINFNSHSTKNKQQTMCNQPSLAAAIPIYINTQDISLCAATNDNKNDHANKNNNNNAVDDEESVSTLGSCEELNPCSTDSVSCAKRPIFGDYWNDKGARSKRSMSVDTDKTAASTLLSKCSHQATLPMPEEFAYQEFNRDFFQYNSCDSTTDGYEQFIKQIEVGTTAMPHFASLKDATDAETASGNLGSERTRNIFKNKYSTSVTSLPSYAYAGLPTPARKSSSTSSLRRYKRSSLRKSTSADSTALDSVQSSSTRMSVSFDSTVFVHEYDKPRERYTADGWSKLFV